MISRGSLRNILWILTPGSFPQKSAARFWSLWVTPLAYDEFDANGEGYQRMIDASAAQRVASSDEIADAAAFLLGEHAQFVNGIDLLIDGGVIAAIRTREYQLG